MFKDYQTFLIGITLFSLLLTLINAIRASHWKARYEELDRSYSTEGWQAEVAFLRRLVNKDAAEATEDRF